MRYVSGFVLGLLGGIAAALALVYFNPLTGRQAAPSGNPTRALAFDFAPDWPWLATHDPRLELPVTPEGTPLLWEGGIRQTLLAALPLVGDDLEGAAATRVSVPSTQTEFLRLGFMVDDYWLISVPGQGSLFVHAESNVWPLLRDTVVRSDWLRRSWKGPEEYGPTVGPDRVGATTIGLTGRYAGVRGRARERLRLETYSPGTGLAGLSGELLLDLPPGQP